MLRVLGLAGLQKIGLDSVDRFSELLFALEERDRVVIAFAHLAPVQALQYGHVVIHPGPRQHEQLGDVVIETLRDIAGHLHVLNLIPPYRDVVGSKHKDVRRHQHGVAEQPHAHAEVRLLPRLCIGLDRGFVGVGAIHQSLGGATVENPGQFGDLGNIRLAIKHRPIGVQTQGQPGGGNFQRRAPHLRRVRALDQRVVIGEKEKRLAIRRRRGRDRGAYRADIITQVRCARGGDPGQYAACAHDAGLAEAAGVKATGGEDSNNGPGRR